MHDAAMCDVCELERAESGPIWIISESCAPSRGGVLCLSNLIASYPFTAYGARIDETKWETKREHGQDTRCRFFLRSASWASASWASASGCVTQPQSFTRSTLLQCRQALD
jgi:hypothetical protein